MAEAPSSAEAANDPVQPCPAQQSCGPVWAQVGQEQARIDGMKDPFKRNQAITASYAKMNLGSPELQWAGVAAFASKQVGCSMTSAFPIGRAARPVAGPGNLAVYDELYPPLRFYQLGKAQGMTNDQIMSCLESKPGPTLNEAITTGIKQMMNGDPAQGANTMLYHEQHDTLQHSVYDSYFNSFGLRLNELTGDRLVSERLVFSEHCIPGPTDQSLDFADYPGHITDFESRWPFAQDVATRFGNLSSNPQTAPAIQSSLRALSTGQYPGLYRDP